MLNETKRILEDYMDEALNFDAIEHCTAQSIHHSDIKQFMNDLEVDVSISFNQIAEHVENDKFLQYKVEDSIRNYTEFVLRPVLREAKEAEIIRTISDDTKSIDSDGLLDAIEKELLIL